MLNLTLLITLLVAAFSIYIGARVYFADRKSATHVIFFILTIETSLWMVINYFSKVTTDPEFFLLLVRLVMTITAPLPEIMWLFARAFPNRKLKFSSTQWWILISWTIFNVFFNLTPFVFIGSELSGGVLTPIPGWGMSVYVFNLAFSFFVIWQFIKNNTHVTGIQKIRLQYLNIGLVLEVINIVLCNFILVIFFKNSNLLVFGTWSLNIILVTFIGYSLLKTRFSAIDFTMARMTYRAAICIWIALPFLIFHYFENIPSPLIHIIGIPTALFWLWCFLQIYEKFEPFLIMRIVNHGADWHTEKNHFLQEVSKEVNFQAILDQSLIFYDRLIKNHGNLIIGDFFEDSKISTVGDYKLHTSARELYEVCYKLWPSAHQEIKSLIYEELVLLKNYRFDPIIKLMTKNGIGAIFAITFYDELKGILVMSNKLNENPYFVQDIEMIEDTLAEIGPILNKTVIYQNSQNFNAYLQKKIDRATLKLKKTNEKLIIADQLKDEFVSVASHELRTPMTAIKNYLWIIEKNLASGKTHDNQKYLQIAINSTDRLLDLVSDMLTISRIEGNRYNLNRQVHDLRDLSKEVYRDLLPLAHSKKLTFKLDLDSKPVLVSIDSSKIFEVLHNLVGNALKFTKEGGVTIKCYVKNNKSLFAVIDTGPGIAAEDTNKLFKKFTRLEKSYVKIKETGTGLGLYISKEIMNLHDGDITFISKPDYGSTFTATFPKAKKHS